MFDIIIAFTFEDLLAKLIISHSENRQICFPFYYFSNYKDDRNVHLTKWEIPQIQKVTESCI